MIQSSLFLSSEGKSTRVYLWIAWGITPLSLQSMNGFQRWFLSPRFASGMNSCERQDENNHSPKASQVSRQVHTCF